VLNFYRNLDKNISSIAEDLRNGNYQPGPYNLFLIKDPKERIISASPIRDRIVQHAIMNYYNPVFDRNLIFDSYACRTRKGTHKAILRAFHFAKSSPYFLKMDVRKYFDSYNVSTGKGIPIGNLTSQFFANYYLSPFDHYFKEQRHARRYIRYMDDILIFSKSKDELKEMYKDALCYAEEKLRLLLKPQISGATKDGAPFLGFLIKQNGIYLQQKTKKRYKVRIAEIEYKKNRGIYKENEAGLRAESVTAHLLIARSLNFRNNVLNGRVFGV